MRKESPACRMRVGCPWIIISTDPARMYPTSVYRAGLALKREQHTHWLMQKPLQNWLSTLDECQFMME